MELIKLCTKVQNFDNTLNNDIKYAIHLKQLTELNNVWYGQSFNSVYYKVRFNKNTK